MLVSPVEMSRLRLGYEAAGIARSRAVTHNPRALRMAVAAEVGEEDGASILAYSIT